ncbi:hypothetical protein DPEC_G00361790 [Dallia pectoralis]|nr:hypothetical protein DPEC_G00361790 [Dallia pectoralis]
MVIIQSPASPLTEAARARGKKLSFSRRFLVSAHDDYLSAGRQRYMYWRGVMLPVRRRAAQLLASSAQPGNAARCQTPRVHRIGPRQRLTAPPVQLVSGSTRNAGDRVGQQI